MLRVCLDITAGLSHKRKNVDGGVFEGIVVRRQFASKRVGSDRGMEKIVSWRTAIFVILSSSSSSMG